MKGKKGKVTRKREEKDLKNNEKKKKTKITLGWTRT